MSQSSNSSADSRQLISQDHSHTYLSRVTELQSGLSSGLGRIDFPWAITKPHFGHPVHRNHRGDLSAAVPEPRSTYYYRACLSLSFSVSLVGITLSHPSQFGFGGSRVPDGFVLPRPGPLRTTCQTSISHSLCRTSTIGARKERTCH